MDVIDIEERPRVVNSEVLEITGNSNMVKIQRHSGHIVYNGNDASIYLGCEPEQIVDHIKIADLLHDAIEVVQLLIILLIFVIILKITDVYY